MITIEHYEDAQADRASPFTTKGNKHMTIRRFVRRYALSLATLALAASVVPLFSTAASASVTQEPISPQSTAPVVSYGAGLATTVVDANHDVLPSPRPRA